MRGLLSRPSRSPLQIIAGLRITGGVPIPSIMQPSVGVALRESIACRLGLSATAVSIRSIKFRRNSTSEASAAVSLKASDPVNTAEGVGCSTPPQASGAPSDSPQSTQQLDAAALPSLTVMLAVSMCGPADHPSVITTVASLASALASAQRKPPAASSRLGAFLAAVAKAGGVRAEDLKLSVARRPAIERGDDAAVVQPAQSSTPVQQPPAAASETSSLAFSIAMGAGAGAVVWGLCALASHWRHRASLPPPGVVVPGQQRRAPRVPASKPQQQLQQQQQQQQAAAAASTAAGVFATCWRGPRRAWAALRRSLQVSSMLRSTTVLILRGAWCAARATGALLVGAAINASKQGSLLETAVRITPSSAPSSTVAKSSPTPSSNVMKTPPTAPALPAPAQARAEGAPVARSSTTTAQPAADLPSHTAQKEAHLPVRSDASQQEKQQTHHRQDRHAEPTPLADAAAPGDAGVPEPLLVVPVSQTSAAAPAPAAAPPVQADLGPAEALPAPSVSATGGIDGLVLLEAAAAPPAPSTPRGQVTAAAAAAASARASPSPWDALMANVMGSASGGHLDGSGGSLGLQLASQLPAVARAQLGGPQQPAAVVRGSGSSWEGGARPLRRGLPGESSGTALSESSLLFLPMTPPAAGDASEDWLLAREPVEFGCDGSVGGAESGSRAPRRSAAGARSPAQSFLRAHPAVYEWLRAQGAITRLGSLARGPLSVADADIPFAGPERAAIIMDLAQFGFIEA